jgi:hypothetical protein
VPAGYTLVSHPRKPLSNNSRRGGGIALIIRDTFKFKKSKLSSPDILVLDMGSIWLIGAYIPPASSRWEGWTDVEPSQKLRETMALCTQSCDKYVALLGDINSRTGPLQSSLPLPGWAEDWKRTSSDPYEKINARGRALVEDCTLYNLCILNGTSLDTAF